MNNRCSLELGFSLPWFAWGENYSKMFHTFVFVEKTNNKFVISPILLKIIQYSTTFVDLTDKKIIKNTNCLYNQSKLNTDNLIYGYKMVPVKDFMVIIDEWNQQCKNNFTIS